MDSTKIRRILCVFFALLNVLFLLLYHMEYKAELILDDEFAANAAQNISARGVDISADVFSLHIPENSIYSFKTVDGTALSETLSQSIAKSSYGTDVDCVLFDVPDGVSVSIYKKGEAATTSELANLVINPKSFYLQYTDSFYSGVNVPEGALTNMEIQVNADEKQAIVRFTEALCKESSYGCKITGSSMSGDGLVVTICQTASDTIIDGCSMNVLLWNNSVVFASGHWITSVPENRYSNSLIDGINAVYKLNFENVSAVLGQRIVYTTHNVSENMYYLLPTWEISCLDVAGNAKIYKVDALEE